MRWTPCAALAAIAVQTGRRPRGAREALRRLARRQGPGANRTRSRLSPAPRPAPEPPARHIGAAERRRHRSRSPGAGRAVAAGSGQGFCDGTSAASFRKIRGRPRWRSARWAMTIIPMSRPASDTPAASSGAPTTPGSGTRKPWRPTATTYRLWRIMEYARSAGQCDPGARRPEKNRNALWRNDLHGL